MPVDTYELSMSQPVHQMHNLLLQLLLGLLLDLTPRLLIQRVDLVLDQLLVLLRMQVLYSAELKHELIELLLESLRRLSLVRFHFIDLGLILRINAC